MINHSYIDIGVAKVDYSNGKSIIINYNDQDYNYGGNIIKSMSYSVIGGI